MRIEVLGYPDPRAVPAAGRRATDDPQDSGKQGFLPAEKWA